MVELLQVSKSDWTRVYVASFTCHLVDKTDYKVMKKFSLSNSSLRVLAEGQNVNEARLKSLCLQLQPL